jgi:crotonobetainyl-CoA:carnitine CoA-transferase CaiB-like acyl-CoA transferase
MTADQKPLRPAVLAGIRVLDISHQYSGANAGSILADLGADVVAIENPEGSPIRTMLPKKDGQSLWWKVIQRGKRVVTLKLSTPEGRDMFLKMAKEFDVVIENFRPGTLEKWGIGPADLERAGANLMLLRISGFGQSGPNRNLPGFGTVAEALSGFAHMNGFRDGPPVFPSTTLGDGVASLFGLIGVLAGLTSKLRQGTKGVEVVDVALFEALFRIIPTQIATYDQLGKAPKRPGNFLGEHGVLRSCYASQDGRYLIVSAVGPQAIRRILVAARADALIAECDGGIMSDPDTGSVQRFLSECNEHLIAWTAARPYEALAADLRAADAVHSPVYSAADIMQDPHFQAREDVIRVADEELGPIAMQGIVPKFPGREHTVKHAGRRRGADNEAVFGELLGLAESDLAQLRKAGVI